MARILINECKQEVSSFNPVLGQYEDFAVAFGSDVLTLHRGVGTEVGGALDVFGAHPELELIGGYSARAITSGGTLADAAMQRIASEFLDAVRAHRDVDAIYFSLHGALASQTEHDAEGYLLAETRKIVGEQVPIVTSLDLHGILTDRIIQHRRRRHGWLCRAEQQGHGPGSGSGNAEAKPGDHRRLQDRTLRRAGMGRCRQRHRSRQDDQHADHG